MASAELARITTKDQLELQGLFFRPRRKSDVALLHIPGWVGNFYENRFIDSIASQVTSCGAAFLTLNNRGSGIVQDFIAPAGNRFAYRRIGGSLERFKECILDIGAALDFIAERGYRRVILQGHSLGCQKILYYYARAASKRIAGLILLAPVDDLACVKAMCGTRYRAYLSLARGLAAKNNSRVLPRRIEFYPNLCAERFLDLADPRRPAAQLLNYSGKLSALSSVKVPVLAVFGATDQYAPQAPAHLKKIAKHARKAHTYLLPDCPHTFWGSEAKLADVVKRWMEEHFCDRRHK